MLWWPSFASEAITFQTKHLIFVNILHQHMSKKKQSTTVEHDYRTTTVVIIETVQPQDNLQISDLLIIRRFSILLACTSQVSLLKNNCFFTKTRQTKMIHVRASVCYLFGSRSTLHVEQFWNRHQTVPQTRHKCASADFRSFQDELCTVETLNPINMQLLKLGSK